MPNCSISDFQNQLDLLKQELATTQTGIATYGEYQFRIKNWAITLLTAFVVFDDDERPETLWVGAGVVILFWVLDGFYKQLQQVYIARAVDLEEQLNSFFQDESRRCDGQLLKLEKQLQCWEKHPGTVVRKTLRACLNIQIAFLYLSLLGIVVVVERWFV